MYAIDAEQNVTVDISAAGVYGNDVTGEMDLSIIDKNFDDISPTGAGSRHAYNPSFLTKEYNISRHERQKSAMNVDSEPCVTLEGQNGNIPGELLTTGNNQQYATANAGV